MSENKAWSPVFTPNFRKHLLWLAKQDKKKIDKILDLVEATTCQQPFKGIGKPYAQRYPLGEPLKYIDANVWSRRITIEHRLVYRISGDRIYFLQCRYHYDE